MERERLIDAEWQHDEESGSSGLYRAEIKIYGNNRTGLLVDITKVFTKREIDIDSIHSKQASRELQQLMYLSARRAGKNLQALWRDCGRSRVSLI